MTEAHPATTPDEAAAAPEWRRLHPAVRIVWLIRSVIVSVCLVVTLAITETVFRFNVTIPFLPPAVATIVIGLAILGLSMGHALWAFAVWRYAVRPADVLLEYGVVWRMRRCVPRVRIQHVDIEAGPIDRLFGIARLSLFTAGTITAVGAIPGLDPRAAEALRETLLETEPRDA